MEPCNWCGNKNPILEEEYHSFLKETFYWVVCNECFRFGPKNPEEFTAVSLWDDNKLDANIHPKGKPLKKKEVERYKDFLNFKKFFQEKQNVWEDFRSGKTTRKAGG